jgi:hypothetical protein
LRGGAVWQLVGLITRRSQVQILPPLPLHLPTCSKRIARRAARLPGSLASSAREEFRILAADLDVADELPKLPDRTLVGDVLAAFPFLEQDCDALRDRTKAWLRRNGVVGQAPHRRRGLETIETSPDNPAYRHVRLLALAGRYRAQPGLTDFGHIALTRPRVFTRTQSTVPRPAPKATGTVTAPRGWLSLV